MKSIYDISVDKTNEEGSLNCVNIFKLFIWLIRLNLCAIL